MKTFPCLLRSNYNHLVVWKKDECSYFQNTSFLLKFITSQGTLLKIEFSGWVQRYVLDCIGLQHSTEKLFQNYFDLDLDLDFDFDFDLEQKKNWKYSAGV